MKSAVLFLAIVGAVYGQFPGAGKCPSFTVVDQFDAANVSHHILLKKIISFFLFELTETCLVQVVCLDLDEGQLDEQGSVSANVSDNG